MPVELKPVRSEADYESVLAEIERLWGAKAGTRRPTASTSSPRSSTHTGEHSPIDPPDPIEVIKFRMKQQGLTRS